MFLYISARFLQQWSKIVKSNAKPGSVASPKVSAFNSTFTISNHKPTTPDQKGGLAKHSASIKTPDNYHVLPDSQLSHKVKEKLQEIASYEMTPAEKDPLYAYENYSIENLSSEDSTDDEDHPKKVGHKDGGYV